MHTEHLFRSATAIVALCGHVDREPKTERSFEDLPASVCSECHAVAAGRRQSVMPCPARAPGGRTCTLPIGHPGTHNLDPR